jgi:hypothetical protein
MPTDIKLKNSVTATNAPTSLQQGEVAINITDKKVWVGNAATTPVLLLGSGSDASFTNISVSGVASFADGTVSLPSITNIGDTNTGIFFPAADTIAFTEGGAESMRIDASGNVGIGVTAPAVRLDLLASGSGDIVKFGVPASSRIINFYRDSANFAITDASGIAGNGMYGITTTNNLAFLTNSSERMRIDSSGRVGIGTSSPSYPLDVLSNSSAIGVSIRGRSADNLSIYNFTSNDGATQYGFILGSPTELRLTQNGANVITAYTNGAERMRIESSGNVGIGTSSPATKLDFGPVSNNTQIISVRQNGNNRAGLGINSDFGLRVTGPSDATATISFGSISVSDGSTFTERMRITSAGDVGIGTSNPTPRGTNFRVLQIEGGATGSELKLTNSTNTGGLVMQNSGNDTYLWNIANSFLSFGTNATERMRIDSGGDVLFGQTTYTNPPTTGTDLLAGGLVINPTRRTTASAANCNWDGTSGNFARVTSSLRYKKEVINASHGLEDVLKLRPVTYKGKAKADGDKVFGGLIAEEVDAIGLTEFVEYDSENKPDSLAYGNMVSLAFKAIQEQQTLINNLTTRLNALEGK